MMRALHVEVVALLLAACTPAAPQVLLPYDNANLFVRTLPLQRGPLASWTAWVVPKTVSPAEAAKQTGMSEAQLREVNRIPPRMLVKAGSTLLVPRGEHRLADVPVDIADNATMALAPDAPPLRKMSVKAGRKDSVASVAKRYRVDAVQVAQWNSVSSTASFKPGQSVVVYVAAKAPRGKAVRADTGSKGKPGAQQVASTRPSAHVTTVSKLHVARK